MNFKQLIGVMVALIIGSIIFEPEFWGYQRNHSAPHTSIAASSPTESLATQSTATVGFSPGDAESLVVRAITTAKHTIRLAAYSFTSKPIATALVDASKRGVDVQVVVDKSQRTAHYTSATFLADMGIPVRVDSRYAIMHNKFVVIDGRTVETGSFNYTSAATFKNAENVIVLNNSVTVAATYTDEWNRLWSESAPYAANY